MDQCRSRLKLSENIERHWSMRSSGEIHMDQSLVHTFSWGNSYGPMVLKVLLKFPPTPVLVPGWLFPGLQKHVSKRSSIAFWISFGHVFRGFCHFVTTFYQTPFGGIFMRQGKNRSPQLDQGRWRLASPHFTEVFRLWDLKKSPEGLGNSAGDVWRVPGKCEKSVFENVFGPSGWKPPPVTVA